MFNQIINKARELMFKNPDHSKDYVYAEIYHKLTQLDWIYAQIEIFNKKISIESDFNTMGILEIMTECFYHFAWRIIEIFEKNPDLFDSKRLKRIGIGKVRNLLLLHPEKTKGDGKFYPCFSCGRDGGPQIKSYIGPIKSYDDKGVFINAKEFLDEIYLVIKHKNWD